MTAGDGMVALVSGASSGIGAATARRLAREPGAHVVLLARREERLRSLASELPSASVIACDLTDEQAPAMVAAEVERSHGRLDLLVNNAGGNWGGPFSQTGWESVRRTMALNFDAQVRLTGALLPLLRRSAPSAVVNVSSVVARLAGPGAGGYAASKAALAAWTDSLFLEERRAGVHIGLVLPGFVATESFPQTGLLASPLSRWALSSPEQVAEAILQAGPGRRPERWVPRAYALAGALRTLSPRLYRLAAAATGGRPPSGGSG